MGSSSEGNNATDEGQQPSTNNVEDVSKVREICNMKIARTLFSLRGSVDFCSIRK